MLRIGEMGREVVKRRGRGWLWAGLALGTIALPAPAMALCPAELPAAVEAIARRPDLHRARLGIQVEILGQDTVLYSREGDRFFVPASTLKVLTTAAVLTHLGPEATIATVVYGHTDEQGVTTVQIVGGGDPSFDRADLTALATQLAQQGIRRIDRLYGDDSAFRGQAINPSWEWEDVQAGYGAPVNALILEENALGFSLVPQDLGQPLQVVWDDPDQGQEWQIDNQSTTVPGDAPEFVAVGRDWARPVVRVEGQLRVGASPEPVSISVPNPGEAFLTALQSALTRQGITVGRATLTQTPPPAHWPELAMVQSPPIAALLIPTNQDSNNLYAEALLKQLGRDRDTATDTTAASLVIARGILEDLGVDPAAVVMVDGSGLARKNLVTPAAMVDTLQAMARSPDATVYRDSLAVAGESGTLRHRLQNTPAAGRLWGKSGALSRNFALAGYLEPPQMEPLAFSIFLNNIDVRGSVARQIIDDLVDLLATLQRCPEGDRAPHGG